MKPVKVSGVGCCLLDRIYDHVDFCSPTFRQYMSRQPGDGGLEPGKLAFEEEVERFAGQHFADILPQLTQGRQPDKENIGGPCIVALIGAAQLAYKESVISFYGCHGDDHVGTRLCEALGRTPIDLTHYRCEAGSETASTNVLSDPHYDNGHGERTFVNTIGASWRYLPSEVDDSFYKSDICVFGGTAIVPMIHQGLCEMLQKAHRHGAFTVVNTVYDSLSEKQNPGRRWLLGDSDESYPLIDLLIVDHEESLRLSGTGSIPQAITFFREKGVRAVLVTNGAHDVYLWADSPAFGRVEMQTMPVSAAVGIELRAGRRGDSTGCGDNFVGGVLASVARQMYAGRKSFDLQEACRWGIVSGGFTCFYYGGTYFETHEGEKLQLLTPYYEKYLQQTMLQ